MCNKVCVFCNIDQTGPTDLVTNDDDSPPPVTNGTTVQLEDKESTGESGTKIKCLIFNRQKEAATNKA